MGTEDETWTWPEPVPQTSDVTRCRVETVKHCPCLWLVRGIAGTCDFHVGYKRGLPVLVRGKRFLGLPTFMWPRDTFDRSALSEPQPECGCPRHGSDVFEGGTAGLRLGDDVHRRGGYVRSDRSVRQRSDRRLR